MYPNQNQGTPVGGTGSYGYPMAGGPSGTSNPMTAIPHRMRQSSGTPGPSTPIGTSSTPGSSAHLNLRQAPMYRPGPNPMQPLLNGVHSTNMPAGGAYRPAPGVYASSPGPPTSYTYPLGRVPTATSAAVPSSQIAPPMQMAAPPGPEPTHHPMNPDGPLRLFAPPPGQPRRPRRAGGGPPLTQSIYMTYDSRLKTGVTNMVQPREISGTPSTGFWDGYDPSDEKAAGGSSNTPGWLSAPTMEFTTKSGRLTRKRTINYAENDNDDDFEDDDDDGPGTRGSRGRKSTPNVPMLDQAAKERLEKEKEEKAKENWSYLGERPPGRRLRSRVMQPSKVQYPPLLEEDLVDFASAKPSKVVPVRIEFETDKIRIRDCFLWDINESLITPHYFATILCNDINIPIDPHALQIAEEITRQVREYEDVVGIDVENGYEDEEGKPAKRVLEDEELQGQGEDVDGSDDAEGEKEVDTVEDDVGTEPRVRWKKPKLTAKHRREREADIDCRVILNLDVIISTYNLRDRIEWDLGSTLSPEAFTQKYCAELGLTGEAHPIIATAIHEELLRHKRDAWERGLLKIGSGRHEQMTGPKRLKGVWRALDERDEFGPSLDPMSVQDIEERERDELGRIAK